MVDETLTRAPVLLPSSGDCLRQRLRLSSPHSLVLLLVTIPPTSLSPRQANAVLALTKKKDPVESEARLLEAIACYEWAGASLDKCGVGAIRRDIDFFNLRRRVGPRGVEGSTRWRAGGGRWKADTDISAVGRCRRGSRPPPALYFINETKIRKIKNEYFEFLTFTPLN